MQTKDQGNGSGNRTIKDTNLNYQLTASHSKEKPELSTRQLSPLRLLAIIILAIFMAEIAAMVVVYTFDPLPYVLLTLIDAAIMTALIFPVLYFLSFQPLLSYIQKSQRVEAALLRSMELQERFFDSIDTQIAYMDRDFNFVRVNEAFAWADDRQPEYFIGRNYFELYPHPENQALFQRVVTSGAAFSVNEKPFEYPEHPERGILYLNWSLLPVRGASGNVEGVVLSLVDVTERVRAAEQNRLLSRIVEQTADSVVVTDCDGVIEYVNPAFEQMTGYTKEETLGKMPSVLKSGVHDNLFYKELWETILDGEAFQSEIANRKKNGELFYEEKTITPLRDERGDITHFVATGKDITERKRAEEELRKAYAELELRVQARTEELRIANSELEDEINERRRAEEAIKESEQKYRSLFSNMSEGFGLHEIILDGDGKPCDYRFLELNDAFEKLTGLSRDKILGRTIKEVVPDVEPYWIETYGRVTLTGESVHYINYSAPLGRWYEAYCYSPSQNQFAVVFFDITKRKQAEEALRQGEERYRLALDAAALGTWRHDPATGLLSLDERARSHSGFESDTVTLAQVFSLIHPDDVARVEHEINITLDPANSTGYYATEYRIIHPDGGIRWISVQASVYFEGQGATQHPVQVIGLSQEITERKHAEAALRAANEELTRFNSVMVDRELRMIELKKEVNALCESADQPRRYPLDFEKEERI